MEPNLNALRDELAELDEKLLAVAVGDEAARLPLVLRLDRVTDILHAAGDDMSHTPGGLARCSECGMPLVPANSRRGLCWHCKNY